MQPDLKIIEDRLCLCLADGNAVSFRLILVKKPQGQQTIKGSLPGLLQVFGNKPPSTCSHGGLGVNVLQAKAGAAFRPRPLNDLFQLIRLVIFPTAGSVQPALRGTMCSRAWPS